MQFQRIPRICTLRGNYKSNNLTVSVKRILYNIQVSELTDASGEREDKEMESDQRRQDLGWTKISIVIFLGKKTEE